MRHSPLSFPEQPKPQQKRNLGWHWLWFAPVCVIVLAVSEAHTLHFAFLALKLAWQRWSWEVVLSPSAFFCFSVMFASVVWPIIGLVVIAALVTQRQRWGRVILTIVVLLLFPFVTDFLIWG